MKKDNRTTKPQQHTSNRKENTANISPNRYSFFPLIVVFFVPVLLYLQTVSFGFTHFDDDHIMLEHADFINNITNIPQAFTTDAFIAKDSYFYRPLQTVSYIIDAQFSSGNNPWMFHLSNVLLIGFVAVLLFLLLKKFLIPKSLAFWGTIIFSVHPLFVSSVAWIPARGDLLVTLFSLLSFLFLLQYMQTKRLISVVIHVLSFILALFCKETAAVLPLLFVLYFFCFSKDIHVEKRHVFILVLYTISVIVWYFIRAKIVTPQLHTNDVLGLTAIVANIRTIPESLALLFIPIVAPIPQFTVFKTLSGMVFLGGIVILAFINKTTLKKEKLFYITWFCLFMLPPLLFKGGLIDYLCHRFMLPLIGILTLLLSMVPKQWLEHKLFKTPLIPIAVCLLLAGFSFNQSEAYGNPMGYYTAAVNQNNHSALAYHNRGKLKMNNGNFMDAVADLQEAINLCPKYTEAFSDKGSSLYHLGNMQGAIDDYSKAITLNPNSEGVFYNRGAAYFNLADFKDAIADFTKAIAIRPNDADAYNYRGAALGATGNYLQAMVNFDIAIKYNPQFADAYFNRATTRYVLHDAVGTIVDCENVLNLHPGDERASDLKAAAQQELQKAEH